MITRCKRGGAAVLVAGLLLALPGAAAAYTTAPGYSANDYATGFSASPVNRWGPIGIAFDQSDNLYVADTVDGNVYRFQPGGGTASSATRLTPSPIPGELTGLAVGLDGALYTARYQAGDVVQIDPGTGQVLRTVAQVPCASGLAVDPVSGDLFVSQNQCGSLIYRVSGPDHASPAVAAYSYAHGVDGLVFDRDGMLYADSDGTVLQIDGTSSSSPGAVSTLAYVPHADGLAFGEHTSGAPPLLVANRTDGTVTRVDFSQSPPAETDIFTGGSRGDFAAVDSSGCLYITQSASVVRVSGAGDTCAFEPTTSGSPPPRGVVMTVLASSDYRSPGRACRLMQSARLRLREQGRVRFRSATVYVNRRPVERLRGAAVTAPIVVGRLPRTAFTITVVATTTHGKRVLTTRRFANCAKPTTARCANTSKLALPVPHPRGADVVFVEAFIGGHRVKLVRGRRIATVTLTGLPRGRFTVRLLTRDSRGTQSSFTTSFTGCASAPGRAADGSSLAAKHRQPQSPGDGSASPPAGGGPAGGGPAAGAPLVCVPAVGGLTGAPC